MKQSYEFIGAWTDTEQRTILDRIGMFIPNYYEGYNAWLFYKDRYGFSAKRLSWGYPTWFTPTVERLLYELLGYYG